MRRLWPAMLILTAGCPWSVPTPVARVGHGPAYRGGSAILAAMPVRCASELPVCDRPHAAAVASATRLNLEFAGYNVVDTELLNAEAWRRTKTTTESTRARVPAVPQHDIKGAPISLGAERVELSDGESWADAPPAAQHRLLVAMGVDGVLATEVAMGRARGMARERTLTMRVTVTRLDGEMVWRSECDVETGDYRSDEQALDLATRCAVESASLW